ncbi:hypothetical protein PVV74_03870 [Roseovarius sp. SK2]|nr:MULTISPECIES: hypothetical protein [Roseovarius]MDD9724587.1 hypothetical protein [Roseovarius sp. SK2]
MIMSFLGLGPPHRSFVGGTVSTQRKTDSHRHMFQTETGVAHAGDYSA